MSMDYGKMEFAVSFKPITAFPLDSRSYYESLSAAEAAARGAVEAGSDAGTIHFGQIITVVENGTAQMFQVQPDGTLGEVGGKIEIDENQFVIDEETGKLNLLNFAAAVEGAQPVKQNGKIVWLKPDTTTVEGLSTTVDALDSVVNGTENEEGGRNEDGLVHRVAELESGLENTYNKTETETKIAEEIGKKIHFTAKLTASTSEMTEEHVLYLLKKDDTAGNDVYEEYILINGKAELIGETSTDLSDYVTNGKFEELVGTTSVQEQITAAIEALKLSENYAAKSDFDELAEVVTHMNGGAEEEGSFAWHITTEFNAIKEITDDHEDRIAELETVTIPGLNDKYVAKEEGKGLSTKDFTAELFNKLNNIEDEAKDNVIEIIKIGGVEAEVAEDKSIDIPKATAESLGVVKSSDAENGVKVNEDGTMTVNSLNVNKLVQTEGEFIILNGGDSASGSTEV